MQTQFHQNQAQQTAQLKPGKTQVSAKNANTRRKRTTDEVNADIAKVDELVLSKKMTQIEALNHVGLQSSIYHLRKRQLREAPPVTQLPRKAAKKVDFEQRKAAALAPKAPVKENSGEFPPGWPALEQKTKAPTVPDRRVSDKEFEQRQADFLKLADEFQVLREKYQKLCQFVVENEVMV